jgi:hypothetical protein
MTSMNGEAEIFKTDTRGRVRVPVERREELLDEFERSGLSGMRFAKLTGIKCATLANWVQKRRRSRSEGAGATRTSVVDDGVGQNGPMRLFEAIAETGKGAGTSGGGLLIELACGGRMTVESPVQLRLAAELLGMLGQTARFKC